MAAGAVAVVALAVKVVGVADNVEFVATLLVAPVIMATLLGDRNLGYVAAFVAAVAYLSLRFDDIQDAGATGVVILVVFRAGSYGFVAYVTPLLSTRLQGDAGDAAAMAVARHLRVDVLDPGTPSSSLADGPGAVDADADHWGPADDEQVPVLATGPPEDWDGSPLGPPAPAWQSAPDDVQAGAGSRWDDLPPLDDDLPTTVAAAPVGPDNEFARAWQDEAPLDDWAAESAAARHEPPPAPRVPTGWIDDATSPLGDETIPVGYTGELFLGKELGLLDPMTGPAAAAGRPSNGNGRPSPAEPSPGAGTNGTSRREPVYGSSSRSDPYGSDRGARREPAYGSSGGAEPPPTTQVPAYGSPGAEPPPTTQVPVSGSSGGAEPPPRTQEPVFRSRAAAASSSEASEPPPTTREPVFGPRSGPDPAYGGSSSDSPPFEARSPAYGNPRADGTLAAPRSGSWADPPEPRPGRTSGEHARADLGVDAPAEPRHWSSPPPPAPSGPSPASPAAPAFGDLGPPAAPSRRHDRAEPSSRSHGHGGVGDQVAEPSGGVDPETRLWNAQFFRDRLTAAVDHSRRNGKSFSVVMVQVADEPFQSLPYRRQVALLRELGHQFVPRFVDHLVHLPDGAQHWFAVVLVDTDRPAANEFERRLRSTIAAYLRSRGLRVGEVQSASLTSPDDDEAMATVWASLLGADPYGVGA